MFARGGGEWVFPGRFVWLFVLDGNLVSNSLGFRDFRLCGTMVFDLDSFPYLGLTSLVNSS